MADRTRSDRSLGPSAIGTRFNQLRNTTLVEASAGAHRLPTFLQLSQARASLSRLIADYVSANGPFPIAEQSAEEALFGLRELGNDIVAGQRCLEIGAGTGFFTHLLASAGVNVDAMEPIGPGFDQFRGTLDFVAKRHLGRVRLINARIEESDIENTYDIAVSINVFEHVEDWRTAIRKTLRALKPGGRAIILCPNYDVPYEPHFGIPIVATKSLTLRLFRSHILRHENQHNNTGLWESLNFISGSQVRRFCGEEGIRLSVDREIMSRMFRRVIDDPGFRDRRGALARPLAIAEWSRIPRLFRWLPIRLQPYLRMTLATR